jgi:hypothetical protein
MSPRPGIRTYATYVFSVGSVIVGGLFVAVGLTHDDNAGIAPAAATEAAPSSLTVTAPPVVPEAVEATPSSTTRPKAAVTTPRPAPTTRPTGIPAGQATDSPDGPITAATDWHPVDLDPTRPTMIWSAIGTGRGAPFTITGHVQMLTYSCVTTDTTNTQNDSGQCHFVMHRIDGTDETIHWGGKVYRPDTASNWGRTIEKHLAPGSYYIEGTIDDPSYEWTIRITEYVPEHGRA